MLAVRLCDVSPTGESSLVTRGVLNLTRRHDRERPTALQPGQTERVTVALNSIGYRFAAGHRVRLSVAPSYWPWVWPAPHDATLTLALGECRLRLPVRRDGGLPAPTFAPVEVAPPLAIEVLETLSGQVVQTTDLLSDRVDMVVEPDGLPGLVRLTDSGLVVGEWGRNSYGIVEGDPLSATVRCERTMEIGGPGWRTVTEVDSTMSCDAEAFHVQTRLSARDGDEPFFEHIWIWSTPRVLG